MAKRKSPIHTPHPDGLHYYAGSSELGWRHFGVLQDGNLVLSGTLSTDPKYPRNALFAELAIETRANGRPVKIPAADSLDTDVAFNPDQLAEMLDNTVLASEVVKNALARYVHEAPLATDLQKAIE